MTAVKKYVLKRKKYLDQICLREQVLGVTFFYTQIFRNIRSPAKLHSYEPLLLNVFIEVLEEMQSNQERRK